MYSRSDMQEIIDNGTMIKSTQKAIGDLDDILDNLESQVNQCPTLMPEMILQNHIVLVKEQRKLLTNKLESLIDRRRELQKTIICDSDDDVATIDRIVAKLLAIDDIYIETHKTSNFTIMSFVEDLLKKNDIS